MEFSYTITLALKIFFSIILLIISSILLTADKKQRIKYSKIIIICICIWCIFFITDFIRIKFQKSPIFCERYLSGKFFSLQDGGTTQYIGLGYKVIHFNTIQPNLGMIKYYYICAFGTTYEDALNKVIEEISKK